MCSDCGAYRVKKHGLTRSDCSWKDNLSRNIGGCIIHQEYTFYHRAACVEGNYNEVYYTLSEAYSEF